MPNWIGMLLIGSKRLLFVGLVMAAVLSLTAMKALDLGLVARVLGDGYRHEPGLLVSPPSSLQQLVEESEVVVLGQVASAVSTDRVFPPGYSPNQYDVRAGVPHTNFRVAITRYVKGTGPQEITLRQLGDLSTSQGPAEFPRPTFGRPVLLFLTRVAGSDGTWWSHRGPWGRMSEEGGVVRYEVAVRTPVPFFAGKTMDQAIRDVVALSTTR